MEFRRVLFRSVPRSAPVPYHAAMSAQSSSPQDEHFQADIAAPCWPPRLRRSLADRTPLIAVRLHRTDARYSPLTDCDPESLEGCAHRQHSGHPVSRTLPSRTSSQPQLISDSQGIFAGSYLLSFQHSLKKLRL